MICSDGCLFEALCKHNDGISEWSKSSCPLYKPRSDFMQIKRGHWIVSKTENTWNEAQYPTEYTCSVCGKTETQEEPYCHCGAKMDEGTDDSLADFVRVTRCKDCERSEMYCFGPDEKAVLACVEKDEEDGQIYFAKAVDPMGYCSCGKRKTTPMK